MLTSKLRSINHTDAITAMRSKLAPDTRRTSSHTTFYKTPVSQPVRTVVVKGIRGRDAANLGFRALRNR